MSGLERTSRAIGRGERFGIIGRSGAGKSTPLRTINMLERPDAGQVRIDGADIGALDENGLVALRRRIGMIFQHFNLLSAKTVFDNVALPLRVVGVPRKKIGARVGERLDLVGLSSKADAYPAMLSSVLVNMFRSIPFIILLVAMLPVTRMIVGTTMGTWAAVVPLSAHLIPFFARISLALNEIDPGLVEAARAMGCRRWHIAQHVLLPEAMPAIIGGATVTVIAMIGSSAMAGAVGPADRATSRFDMGMSATRPR